MRSTVVAIVLAAAACGAPPAQRPVPPAPVASTPAPEPPATGRYVRTIEIVAADLMPVVRLDEAEAKRWAADPANTRELRPKFRHFLAKDDRARAEAVIARLSKGEDLATLAKDSDDPGSAKRGGAYDGIATLKFVDPVLDAYEALTPGSFTREPVKSNFGWHVIAKDPVDDEARIVSYRLFLARKAAETIAKAIQPQMRELHGKDAKAVVTEAYQSAVGSMPKTSFWAAHIERHPAESELAAWCKDVVAHARARTIERRKSGDYIVSVLTDEDAQPGEETRGRCTSSPPPADAHASKEPADRSEWIATPLRKARLFEVMLVDDTDAPIQFVPDKDVPSGFEIRWENVPVGREDVRGYFARFPNAELARGRTWLATVRHRKEMAFVLEPLTADGGKIDAYRTYVVQEPALLDETDVARAEVITEKDEPYVRWTLKPDSAKRFEKATEAWNKRRIAILVDGLVVVAPIVKGVITSGVGTLPPPGETVAARRASAARIARSLSRH
jgi:hypothetical protein